MGNISQQDRDKARADWIKAHPGQSPNEEAITGQVYQNFYDKAFNATGLGTGGAIQQGIQAATAAVQSLAGGDVAAAIANGAAPYLAEVIGHRMGIDDNPQAKAVAHAIVGAALAAAQGQNAGAGAAGAALGEITAGILKDQLYGADTKISDLTETQKQTLSALATLSSGLAGGLVADSTASAVYAAQAGKVTVENNFLGPKDQSRLEELRKKRDEHSLTKPEKIEMFMLDELDQKGDYLVGKYSQDPKSLTDAEAQRLAASLSRYYQQVEGMSGEDSARQSVNDLLTGKWGYRPANYEFPYLGSKEQQERYVNNYQESITSKSFIEKLFTSRPMDINEEYYREQYAIQKYIQSTEWERQVGRPVMNFLPGIGAVYNAIDTAHASYDFGQASAQLYQDGQFTTDTVLKMVNGTLTLTPVVISGLISKGNPNTVANIDPLIPKTELAPGNNAIGSINSGKPGSIAVEKGSTPNTNELRAGNALLGLGYDVVIKKEANQHKIRTPDFWVNGIGKVDVYTPKTVSSKNIISSIEKKDSQTSSVLLQINLANKDMNSIATRVWEKPNVKNINTIFFQDSKGLIHRFDRPVQGGK